MDKKEFKQKRAELRLSQMKLASLLGVDSSTIYRWETGKTPIPEHIRLAMWALKAQKAA